MASETTTPPTPPQLIRIVTSPYDSDNDETTFVTSPNSFIHAVTTSEKKQARTKGGGSKKIAFLDELSRNAAGLQSFGQSMAVHANRTLFQTLAAPAQEETDDDEERSDGGYDSEDSQRRWRNNSKLDLFMGTALDRADRYAMTLCNHVPRGCVSNALICVDDDSYSHDSWSSFEDSPPRKERRSRASKKKKKKAKKKKAASSAVPYSYDGNLDDSLSLTSCDATYDEKYEDISPLPAEEVSSSSPKKKVAAIVKDMKVVSAIAPCTKASLIRQRREEFMRRKDSGEETGAVVYHGKRPEIKKVSQYVPSQELRAKYFGSAHRRLTELNRERSELTKQQDDDDELLYGESIPDLVDSSGSSNDDSEEQPKSKWQSKFAEVDMPIGDCSIFLTPSHLGSSISRVPLDVSALQIGDIILRLNGEDVSGLTAERIEDIFSSMSGKQVNVSFLRKRMEM